MIEVREVWRERARRSTRADTCRRRKVVEVLEA